MVSFRRIYGELGLIVMENIYIVQHKMVRLFRNSSGLTIIQSKHLARSIYQITTRRTVLYRPPNKNDRNFAFLNTQYHRGRD